MKGFYGSPLAALLIGIGVGWGAVDTLNDVAVGGGVGVAVFIVMLLAFRRRNSEKRRPMNKHRRILIAALAATVSIAGAPAHAQASASLSESPPPDTRAPICSSEASPYRDFDFLIGDWNFFSLNGEKIGEHIYHERGQGCLILEEWSTPDGDSGVGMNFVDPETGLWRQVWMSQLFHIDYSGSLDDNGAMVLEGRIYPNVGGESAPVRGVWTKLDDGSVRQEFFQYSEQASDWVKFFAGVSRRKQE